MNIQCLLKKTLIGRTGLLLQHDSILSFPIDVATFYFRFVGHAVVVVLGCCLDAWEEKNWFFFHPP